jgi:hypothetical protein
MSGVGDFGKLTVRSLYKEGAAISLICYEQKAHLLGGTYHGICSHWTSHVTKLVQWTLDKIRGTSCVNGGLLQRTFVGPALYQ